jgi:hypothetical protein
VCYSAQIENQYSKYLRYVGYDGAMSRSDFVAKYWERQETGALKIPKAIDAWFANPKTDDERKIAQMIRDFDGQQVAKLETDIFAQKKRLADAERTLQTKETKKALNDQRVAAPAPMAPAAAKKSRRDDPLMFSLLADKQSRFCRTVRSRKQSDQFAFRQHVTLHRMHEVVARRADSQTAELGVEREHLHVIVMRRIAFRRTHSLETDRTGLIRALTHACHVGETIRFGDCFVQRCHVRRNVPRDPVDNGQRRRFTVGIFHDQSV